MQFNIKLLILVLVLKIYLLGYVAIFKVENSGGLTGKINGKIYVMWPYYRDWVDSINDYIIYLDNAYIPCNYVWFKLYGRQV